MSTKFAVRPAPRKRPWICKRSPPCLPPPPIPPSLLCTYNIHPIGAPPPNDPFGDTFRLTRVLPFLTYYGFSTPLGAFLDCTFTYTVDPPLGRAHASWFTVSLADAGDFWDMPVTLPPTLTYQASLETTTTFFTTGTILITG